MRYLLLLLPFLLTGCYTTYDWSYYTATRQPESLLAVTSQGDTVQVPTYQFYINYQERPTYYNDWRFYYRDTWYNPHSYYTTYYRYYWETTIFYVNKLLSLGVPARQIYVVIEWSDLERHMVHPSHLYDLTHINVALGEFRDIEIYDKELNSELLNKENHHFKEIHSLSSSGYCMMGGMVDYTHLFNVTVTAFSEKNDPDLEFFIQNEQNLFAEQSIEFFVQQYLNYIIKTQNFLKYHGINYNFTSMFSFIQGWYQQHNLKKQIYLHNSVDDISPYSNNSDGKISYNKESETNDYIRENIMTMFPEYHYLYDQLDLTGFWFHNSEKFKYGGIDEWAIDTLGKTGYYWSTQRDRIDTHIQQFRNHPNTLMYILLWNKICKDCEFLRVNENYIDEITTKYWEDYNSDKSTEHGVSISKKYLDLEIEKYNDSV